jgi:hypothetical protein
MKTICLANPEDRVNAVCSLSKPQSKVIWWIKYIWIKITFYEPCNLKNNK